MLTALEKRLLKKSPADRKYIVGNKSPTIADFALTSFAFNVCFNPLSYAHPKLTEILTLYPLTSAYFHSLGSLPRISDHLSTRFASPM